MVYNPIMANIFLLFLISVNVFSSAEEKRWAKGSYVEGIVLSDDIFSNEPSAMSVSAMVSKRDACTSLLALRDVSDLNYKDFMALKDCDSTCPMAGKDSYHCGKISSFVRVYAQTKALLEDLKNNPERREFARLKEAYASQSETGQNDSLMQQLVSFAKATLPEIMKELLGEDVFKIEQNCRAATLKNEEARDDLVNKTLARGGTLRALLDVHSDEGSYDRAYDKVQKILDKLTPDKCRVFQQLKGTSVVSEVQIFSDWMCRVEERCSQHPDLLSVLKKTWPKQRLTTMQPVVQGVHEIANKSVSLSQVLIKKLPFFDGVKMHTFCALMCKYAASKMVVVDVGHFSLSQVLAGQARAVNREAVGIPTTCWLSNPECVQDDVNVMIAVVAFLKGQDTLSETSIEHLRASIHPFYRPTENGVFDEVHKAEYKVPRVARDAFLKFITLDESRIDRSNLFTLTLRDFIIINTKKIKKSDLPEDMQQKRSSVVQQKTSASYVPNMKSPDFLLNQGFMARLNFLTEMKASSMVRSPK